MDGWGHFQRRATNDDEYSYEPHSFGSLQPARVVWEVLSLLSSELESK